MSQPKIVVVGSYAVGFTMQTNRFPTPGQTVEGFGFQAFHGGKGSNQAVECARQEAQVSLIACLGDDIYGRQALELYKTERVDSAAIRVVKEQGTGVGFIIVEQSGENEIIIDPGANSCLCVDDIRAQEALIASAQALLVQLEIPNEPVMEALALAKAHGVLSILNPAPFRRLPAAALSTASLITPNETEARLLLGLSPTQSIDTKFLGTELAKLGSGRSVITLGGRGALITDQDKQELIAPFAVEPVDTTGAGDTFTAALGVSLTQGATLKEAARFAAAAAAISVTRYGVIESMPTRAETLALLR